MAEEFAEYTSLRTWRNTIPPVVKARADPTPGIFQWIAEMAASSVLLPTSAVPPDSPSSESEDFEGASEEGIPEKGDSDHMNVSEGSSEWESEESSESELEGAVMDLEVLPASVDTGGSHFSTS